MGLGNGHPASMLKVLLVVLGAALVATDPPVFDDYFDDNLRYVDIPQEFVLKSCLADDVTAKKVNNAYDSCFGKDYSFDDLAKNVDGPDSDKDGLPNEYEGNEACFYKAMGWAVKGKVDAAAIKADMAGLEEGVKNEFNSNIDTCTAWGGSFGRRRRRSVLDTESEKVPSLMESGSKALGWVRSLTRRSAEAGREPKRKKYENEGGKKCKGKKCNGNGKKRRNGQQGGRNRNGKGAGGKKDQKAGDRKPKKDGKGRGKKPNSNNGGGNNRRKVAKGDDKKKDEKKKKKEDKKTRGKKGGKSNEQTLNEATYNKLWCFDLAMEQALEKCVEEKMNN